MGRLGESKSALISTRRAIFCIQHDLLKKFWPQEFAPRAAALGNPAVRSVDLFAYFVCPFVNECILPPRCCNKININAASGSQDKVAR